MNAKNVLRLMAQYLGDIELSEVSQLGGDKIATSQQNEKIDTMLEAINDTVQVLATMYFPLKTEETINSKSGVVLFSELCKPIIKILKLTNKHKKSIEYAFFPMYFETLPGVLNIVYTYLPEHVTDLDAELEVVKNKVTTRMVAIGAVSTYFMMTGMYNDASAWNNMFERACLVASGDKSIHIKKRSWY